MYAWKYQAYKDTHHNKHSAHSTNTPTTAYRAPRAHAASDAAIMPADVRLLSTTSTPCGRTTAASTTNTVLRDCNTCSTPSQRSVARFRADPAVPTTHASRACRSCTAAMPTPPDNACTSTTSSAHTPAMLSAACAVIHTVGMPAASIDAKAAGRGTQVAAGATTVVPRAPSAKPTTRCPGVNCVWQLVPTASTVPAKSVPGGALAPGYMPSTMSASLKLSPVACGSYRPWVTWDRYNSVHGFVCMWCVVCVGERFVV